MNMLPINSEWKRRIKWADTQRKEQASKVSKQFVRKTRVKANDKYKTSPED